VNFSASATDNASGTPNVIDWDFGDNTAHASGANASHTYTTPGTYVAKASTSDGAGNSGNGTVTITVAPASSGGGSTGGNTNTSGGGRTVTPSHVTSQQVSQSAGGGGTQHSAVGGLSLVAPKRFTAGKRTLMLAATTTSAGKASIAVLKGSKIVARKGATFAGPGTYAVNVRLPKRLKPGSYSIKVSFTPAGATTGTTKTLKLKVVSRKKKKRHHKVALGHGIPAARFVVPRHR
jgi:PKD repeat protein